MDDPNIIVTLYPVNTVDRDLDFADMTVRMAHNAPFYVPEQLGPADAPGSPSQSQCDWSQTPEPDEDSAAEKQQPGWAAHPGLRLRFNQPRKQRSGFTLGTAEGCDIRLPKAQKLKGISGFQCLICFDGHDRLVLKDVRDIGTTAGKRVDGTSVSYQGKGREKRRHFTWILSGTDFTDRPDGRQEILIYLHDNLCFWAVVPPRDHHSDDYRARVAEFRNGSGAPVDPRQLPLTGAPVDPQQLPLTGLGLDGGESTAGVDTGIQTPSEGAIWLRRKTLGQGSFAIVTRLSNVSTGVDYARKQPADGAHCDIERWRQEARLLRRISHENIVRLLADDFSSFLPTLDLEYVPGRTLHWQNRTLKFSPNEVLMILDQGLAALSYLHELDPPIIHRDIKPANILVQHRTADSIHTKLADFGHSKDGHELRTQCGTELYLAPEIQANATIRRDNREPYTTAVDIWSLGVMVYEFAFGLPDLSLAEGPGWCLAIVEKLQLENDSVLADFLANEMLIIDPAFRNTARQCREAAPKPGLVPGQQLPQPPQVVKGEIASSLSSLPTESVRFIRSGAPEPSAEETGKRPRKTTASGSSLASDDRRPKRQLREPLEIEIRTEA
ncbi:kinase-like domain-containing protein [Chaetomium tenue]|uniref:Kinase-like domain-containing protein n=1 Tax=Chaetomium tenue TaxID=1854479 RepID=A0ACB7P2C9_9PEZI|nr:kinase-like domain-containing protein [Chaetomium globosum]